MASSSSRCSRRPYPCRRARAASRTGTGTSSRSAAAPARTGTGRNRPRPDGAEDALFAGVSGTLTSVPSSDPAFSGLLLPMVTAPGSPRRVLPPGRAEHGPAAPPGEPRRARSASPRPPGRRRTPRPRPRHQGQVPGQRDDHVPDRASGISVISTITRIMNALASSRSRSPFTNRASSARPPRSVPMTPGPGPVHPPPAAPASRETPGCPSPGPARPA